MAGNNGNSRNDPLLDYHPIGQILNWLPSFHVIVYKNCYRGCGDLPTIIRKFPVFLIIESYLWKLLLLNLLQDEQSSGVVILPFKVDIPWWFAKCYISTLTPMSYIRSHCPTSACTKLILNLWTSRRLTCWVDQGVPIACDMWLPFNEAIACRAVFVIVSGSSGF